MLLKKKKKNITQNVSELFLMHEKIKSNLSTSEAVTSCDYAEKILTYAFI